MITDQINKEWWFGDPKSTFFKFLVNGHIGDSDPRGWYFNQIFAASGQILMKLGQIADQITTKWFIVEPASVEILCFEYFKILKNVKFSKCHNFFF